MLLRSIRSHLVASCATLALAFVVAAGAVAVVGASRVGHTPAAVAAMLALYGAVALAEQSARSTVDRIHDVALARLRGMTGHAAGRLRGRSAARRQPGRGRARHGRGHPARRPDRRTAGTRRTPSARARSSSASRSCSARGRRSRWSPSSVIRRPLVDALSVHPRRRVGSSTALFLEILVVAAAVLAVYEAHRRGHGWVPIIAPALVALAAGQVVAWLLLLVPRFGRRLGPALTSRRLRRDPDPASVVRFLVAATVLLAVTLTGGRAAAAWRDDSARLRAGGPLVVPFTDGAVRAYAAAHDADPDGRWLMAAVSIDDQRPAERRVFVDAARWPAVVGDFMDGTSAAGATARMRDLAAQPDPVLMRGTSLRVLAVGLRGHGWCRRAWSSRTTSATAATRWPPTCASPATAGRPRTCACAASGCSLLSLVVRGTAPFDVRRVVAGSQDLIADPVSFAGTGRAPLLSFDESSHPASGPGDAGAHHPRRDAPLRPCPGIDGQTPGRAGRRRGRRGALPGPRRQPARPAAGPPRVRSAPWPPPDRWWSPGPTPRPPCWRGCTPTAAAPPRRTPSVRQAFDATPEARADSLALLVAVGVALVALTHLVAWLASQMARRRAEVAGLRAAGLLPRVVRRAYVVEAVALAGIVLVDRRRRRGRHDHDPAAADAPGRRLGRRAGRRPRGPALGADAGRPRGGARDRGLLRGRLHPVRPLRAPCRPAGGRPMTRFRWLPRDEPARPGLAHRAQPRLAAAHGDRDRVRGRRPELPAQRRQLVRDRPARRAAPDQHRPHLRLPAAPTRRAADGAIATALDETARESGTAYRPGHAMLWDELPADRPARLVGPGGRAPGVRAGRLPARRPRRPLPLVAGRDRGPEGRRHDVRLDARAAGSASPTYPTTFTVVGIYTPRARGRRVLVRPAAPDRAGAPAPAARPVPARAVDHDPGGDRADAATRGSSPSTRPSTSPRT